MLLTKLNRPKISNNLLIRQRLIEKLEKNKHQPVILISAPAGYGKSMLVSHWLEQCENNCAWISLDQSMSDSAAFISYFSAALEKCGSVEMPELKKLNQDYNFLSWESIIDKIINEINGLKEPIRLILDDYHLIRNQDIHMLIDAIISENINNFHLVIITRRDPPLQLRELRLYQKILELRIKDLRFNEDEIAALLAIEHDTHYTKDEITELFYTTEGWILAIRLIMMTRSLPASKEKRGGNDFLTNDLDLLVDHIGNNLDVDFLKQMQLCSLFDQFNEDLIDSAFSHVFKKSGIAGSFLAKLQDLNLFLIPVKDEGSWFRFHHLFGDILRKRMKRNNSDIINPLYIHMSSWFAGKGLIDEAIHYAIDAENYELACNLISEHRLSKLENGQWWVIQCWLENIPRKIRQTNTDMLLTELLVCEETWNTEDLSSILNMLESMGIEKSNAENVSLYLYHLGYFLTFVKPDPKRAIASLEKSRDLWTDETDMFGGRRELILATSRQMLGLSDLALKTLDDIQEQKYRFSLKIHVRALHAKLFIHLLSGNFEAARTDSQKFLFHVQDLDFLAVQAWSWYFCGNVAFQAFEGRKVAEFFVQSLSFWGKLNYRVYFDAFAGLILLKSLKGDKIAAEELLKGMREKAGSLKDTRFQIYYQSVRARVNLLRGQGEKELAWAQTDWVKQSPTPYFFLIDVPNLTKIRIIVSHGTVFQVEEALDVIAKVEASLDNLHNNYHAVDIEILKSIALLRIGRKEEAKESLNKSLTLAEQNDTIRPIIEAYLVMPSLFELVDQSFTSRRLLSRIGLKSSNNELAPVSYSKTEELSLREQQVIGLIATGLRNKEIADELNISAVTVKSHLTNIYRKLNVPNRTTMLNKVRGMNILA